MGTFGYVVLNIRGASRACYVRFDSHPQHLGATLVRFILAMDTATRLRMAVMLEKIFWLDYDTYKHFAPPEDIQPACEDYQRFPPDPHLPWLSTWARAMNAFDTGSNLLPAILNGDIDLMIDCGKDYGNGHYNYHLDFRACTFRLGAKTWDFSDLGKVDEKGKGKGYWVEAIKMQAMAEEMSISRQLVKCDEHGNDDPRMWQEGLMRKYDEADRELSWLVYQIGLSRSE